MACSRSPGDSQQLTGGASSPHRQDQSLTTQLLRHSPAPVLHCRLQVCPVTGAPDRPAAAPQPRVDHRRPPPRRAHAGTVLAEPWGLAGQWPIKIRLLQQVSRAGRVLMVTKPGVGPVGEMGASLPAAAAARACSACARCAGACTAQWALQGTVEVGGPGSCHHCPVHHFLADPPSGETFRKGYSPMTKKCLKVCQNRPNHIKR